MYAHCVGGLNCLGANEQGTWSARRMGRGGMARKGHDIRSGAHSETNTSSGPGRDTSATPRRSS
jgi:hypothetical protein